MAKPKVKKPAPKPRPLVQHKVVKLPLPDLSNGLTQYTHWDGPSSPQVERYQEDPTPPTSPVRAVLVEPDPLDDRLGLIYLVAAQRMLEFARQYPQEVDPEAFVRMALARVVAKDPTVKLLTAVNYETGEVLGHTLSMIEAAGSNKWVFCYQAQIDARASGILQQMIDTVIPWAKQHGATSILMASQLNEEFWKRQYNFETVRHVMRREI